MESDRQGPGKMERAHVTCLKLTRSIEMFGEGWCSSCSQCWRELPMLAHWP